MLQLSICGSTDCPADKGFVDTTALLTGCGVLQGIWTALSAHAWQPAAVPLVTALGTRIRERTLGVS
jgi:hypothetical protein